MKQLFFCLFILFFGQAALASKILIPMDESQKNHLKAYGIAYWVLQNEIEIEWLLNYRGGSFLVANFGDISKECNIRGVSFQVIADIQAQSIYSEIADPEVNMERVKLEVAPKIAVYTPLTAQPWDDAVTLAMTYAEIPYEKIYDEEILQLSLHKFDWLHLHHEDFTGQYGKFYAAYKNASWYQLQVAQMESLAAKMGYKKVSQMKLAVAQEIKNFVLGGGFLFTMCSGTDSFDIALAAQNTDICESMFDGDAADPLAQEKLDFDKSMGFRNFPLEKNPMIYEFSDLDGTPDHSKLGKSGDLFTLFDFSAKWDIVPTILTQNHEKVIKGFMGQTTSFRSKYIKPEVTIMGETKSLGVAKYINGTLGQGQWTFYGGHDPEDYQHKVGDPPTDLNLHPNSPGYRLILNNILFPAAKKKEQKT